MQVLRAKENPSGSFKYELFNVEVEVFQITLYTHTISM